MATISPLPKLQFFDANGDPLVGGKLYTYAAGTTTPLATYTSQLATNPASNPIILNARGEAEVWLGANAYKFKLTSATGVEIWTVDNLNTADTNTINSILATLAASGGSSLIGYTQGSGGAITRTVQSRLRDTVSILDFGADPTGVYDSTAAIQAALDCGAQNVYIPAGVYLFSSLTVKKRNTKLYGAAGQSSVLKHTGAGIAITCYDPSNTVPDGRGVYIDAGWFLFEDFELMVNGTTGFFVGKNKTTFSMWNRMYIRHRKDLDSGNPNAEYYPGSIAINCDNTPWAANDSTYVEKVHHTFIRGFETAINLKATVNAWEFNQLYCLENLTAYQFDATTGVQISASYVETGVAGAHGIIFGASGGNQVTVINTAFELTNAAATQYAYDFSAGGAWENICVLNPKYLIQGDGNAVNSKRIIGTAPTSYIEINRTYLSSSYKNKSDGTVPTGGTVIPMMWSPSTSGTNPYQLPNFSRLGGFQQGNGQIRFGRNDTDGIDHTIEHNGSQFAFRSGTKEFLWTSNDTVPLNYLRMRGNAGAFNYFGPGEDSSATGIDLGTASYRWRTVWATTGAISTSDAREKQQDRPLSDAERAVATRLKGLIKAFKFNSSVEEKGDAARIHIGAYAQEVRDAFAAEGLDATKYAMFCYDEWAAEHDAEGNETKPAGNRYALRYDQLLAFIIGAL